MKRPITRLELAIVLVLLIGAGLYAVQVNALYDFIEIAAPANPAANNDRLYADSTSHSLTCLTSSGGSCLSGGGGGVSTTIYYGDPTLTAPTTGTFGTAVNDANAANISFVNDSSGGESGVVLKATATVVDTAIVARLMAVPATPYNFRIRFRLDFLGDDFPLAGVAWYNNGSGKFALFGAFTRGAAQKVRYTTFSDSHTHDGTGEQELGWFGFPARSGIFDLYVSDTGTNRVLYVIGDGVLANRQQFQSMSNTQYITPTHIGIFVGPGANSFSPGLVWMHVIDWTQS